MIEPPPWRELPPLHRASAPQYQRLPGRAGSFPGSPTPDLAGRGRALGLRRKCSECGCDMPRNAPVWQVFTTGIPHATYPGLVTRTSPSPMHESCALYTTLTCPFLRYETSRSRPKETNRGAGAIVGFHQYGVFLTCNCPGGDCMATRMWVYDWAYFDVAEGHSYRSWKDNLELYEAAVAADAEVIDTSTRLSWSDSSADAESLLGATIADLLALKRLRANASTEIDGHTYRLAVL